MSAVSSLSSGGRAASLARRRALSQGKSALPPASERVRTGDRSAALPAPAATSSTPPTPPAARVPSSPIAPGASVGGGGRDQSRARRALLSQRGRGDAGAAQPTRPPRQGTLNDPPKVTESTNHAGQIVTGSRIGRGAQVTGDEPGAHLPVSGSQHIGASDGPPARSGGPKVGLARTAGGSIVSGTLIRSKVRVTGDEAGAGIAITGEAEQTADDDVTPRTADGVHVASQFNRQVDPHGHSVFGTNLGRSASSLGSRDRKREAPIETTENGLGITGSALGRGGRMTGDEVGACRQVTGTQYLTPARARAECGGAARGTSYQGPNTVDGWGEPGAVADNAEERLPRRAAPSSITGDVPEHSDTVTGTGRGAARGVTDARFSVSSPQRSALLRARAAQETQSATKGGQGGAASVLSGSPRITGSFAIRSDRVTGNAEFHFKSRSATDPNAAAARLRLTGEGRAQGTRVTGGSWSEQPNITGTEGASAAKRNPSERSGQPQAFSGARHFKTRAKHEDTKQLVTGLLGWSGKTAAKVTLSGGAQA